MSTSRASSCSAPEADADATDVVLAANNGWNIVNYRGGLIRALREAGIARSWWRPTARMRTRLAAWESTSDSDAAARACRRSRTSAVVLNYVRTLRAIRPAAFLGFTAQAEHLWVDRRAPLACRSSTISVGWGPSLSKRDWLTRWSRASIESRFRACRRRILPEPRRPRAVRSGWDWSERSRRALLPGSGVDLDHFAPASRRRRQPFIFLLSADCCGTRACASSSRRRGG